jgi:predicted FMN-binding regulatory protein PaiB
MYVAEQYRMGPDEVARRLENVRYGNLVTVDPESGRPVATFLPWVFAPGPDRLLTHLAKVNGQWRHTATPALVVLDGLHAAVEAQWTSGFDTGRSAPTVDYETVHVWGPLSAADSREAVYDSWDRMMAAHGSGLTVAQMDADYLQRMAQATVAVEVRIEDRQAKSKLSQSHSPEDIRRIAGHMVQACPALADRVLDVALPWAEAREQAVAEARQKHLTALAQRLAAETPASG